MIHRSLPAFALLLVASVGGAQVNVARTVRDEIAVRSDSVGAKALLSVTQVRTKLPTGRIMDGSLIALFDPTSHLFWWMHLTSLSPTDPETVRREFLDAFAFFVAPDEIVCFTAEGRTLSVRSSQLKVSSLDEGLAKARAALPDDMAKFVSGERLWFQEVPLADAVGQLFFRPKDIGDPPVRLRIGTIERSPSGWRVEIKNDKGDNKTVALSRNFKPA